MKVKILWQVLKVLLEAMKHEYKTSELFNPVPSDSLTDYYFLTNRKKEEKNPISTIGWALQQTFPEQNIAEKSVYNYVHIPASKQRDQFFMLEKRYPAIFFNYIGFNSFPAFLNWCEKENKLNTVILDEQRSLLHQYKEQKFQYYFCYFPVKKQIVQAIATFKNWQTLQLNYIDFQQKAVQLKGKVETKKKQLYIALSRDYQVGLKQDQSVTFLSLSNIDYTSEQPTLLQGTYAGVNNIGQPIAGKIIFEKITEAIAKTASPRFVTNKYQQLLQQNLIIQKTDTFSPRLNPLNPDNRQKQLNKLSGIYKGYICISKEKKDNYPTIVEAISIFRPDGSVECKGYSNIYYNGHIDLFSGGGYAKLATFTEDGAHQFTYLLELKYTDDKVAHMEGVYVGSFKSKLVSGREYFEKLYEYSEENELLINNKLTEYYWADFVNTRPSFCQKLQKYFVKNDQFTLLRQLSSPLASRLQQKRITGVFELYFFSSAKTIRKYILKIDGAANKVWLKTNNNPSNEGTLFIADNYLFLRLQALRESKEYLTQLITFIGNENDKPKLKRLEGIIAGLSDDEHTQRPVSLRCVLIRTKVKFEWASPEQISLGSPAFEQLNKGKLLPDLGYYLSGTNHNFIETHPTTNFQNLRILKNKDIFNKPTHSHAIAMFKAACFTATQINEFIDEDSTIEENQLNQLIEEFLSLVQDAVMHGFGYLPEHIEFLNREKQKSLHKFARAFTVENSTLQIDLCKIYRALPVFSPSMTS